MSENYSSGSLKLCSLSLFQNTINPASPIIPLRPYRIKPPAVLVIVIPRLYSISILYELPAPILIIGYVFYLGFMRGERRALDAVVLFFISVIIIDPAPPRSRPAVLRYPHFGFSNTVITTAF